VEQGGDQPMASATLLEQARKEDWSDEQIVARVLEGETALYELLMRRHNQRLYRVARAILRDDAEAEDVMQDAYVRAYQNLSSFEGRAKFSTWLSRIAVNEAISRSRKRVRFQSFDAPAGSEGDPMNLIASTSSTPERQAYDRELSVVIEQAVSTLTEDYRLVFMLRDVEGMSTEETADCLNLTQENVKVRLHRAHAKLRKEIYAAVGGTAARCFQFDAVRCDRVVQGVFQAIGRRPTQNRS
jgi:RNA polymerase sigma-70 factor (ECF subfamily)